MFRILGYFLQNYAWGIQKDIEFSPTERCAEKKPICMEDGIDQSIRKSVMRIMIDSGGRQHSRFWAGFNLSEML